MKNIKGITLIALIITIIVMLILAGVTISMVVGDNGVLKQAQTAGEKQKYATVKETVLTQMEYSYEGTNVGKVNLENTLSNINKLNLEEIESTGWTDNNHNSITVNLKNGEKIVIDKNGNIVDNKTNTNESNDFGILEVAKTEFNLTSGNIEDIEISQLDGYNISYLSSDINVVAVTNDGSMVGFKPGTATVTITATKEDEQTLTQTLNVTVEPLYESQIELYVTSIDTDEEEIEAQTVSSIPLILSQPDADKKGEITALGHAGSYTINDSDDSIEVVIPDLELNITGTILNHNTTYTDMTAVARVDNSSKMFRRNISYNIIE